MKYLRHSAIHFIIAFVILTSGIIFDYRGIKNPGNWPGLFYYVPIFILELFCAGIYMILRNSKKSALTYWLDAYIMYTFFVYLIFIPDSFFDINTGIQLPEVLGWKLFLLVKGTLIIYFLIHLLLKIIDWFNGLGADKNR